MFMLYRIAFAPVRNHIELLLFRYKNGDFGAISVPERSCVAPISKVESHIWDISALYRLSSMVLT